MGQLIMALAIVGLIISIIGIIRADKTESNEPTNTE
jgi:hypothetical protein